MRMTEKTTDVDRLLEMSQAELDELFRASPAGDIPRGEGEGTVLVARGETLSEIAAKLAQYFVWQGKVFDPDNGELLNLVSPLGIRAVREGVRGRQLARRGGVHRSRLLRDVPHRAVGSG